MSLLFVSLIVIVLAFKPHRNIVGFPFARLAAKWDIISRDISIRWCCTWDVRERKWLYSNYLIAYLHRHTTCHHLNFYDEPKRESRRRHCRLCYCEPPSNGNSGSQLNCRWINNSSQYVQLFCLRIYAFDSLMGIVCAMCVQATIQHFFSCVVCGLLIFVIRYFIIIYTSSVVDGVVE